MRRLNYYFILFFIIMLCVLSHPVYCEESMKEEISHLLEYISSSGCTFIRNSSGHTAEEAIEHIQKKYDYFKSRIKTTEDFIKYAATKSTLSGKLYKVRCSGMEIPCADWLKTELDRFRGKGN